MRIGTCAHRMFVMYVRDINTQEYLDSTQGMVKELHTVHGSVLLRVGALEEAALSSSNGQSYQAGGDVGQVQVRAREYWSAWQA